MHKSRNYFKTALNEITLHFLILAWFPSPGYCRRRRGRRRRAATQLQKRPRLRLTSSLSDDDSTYERTNVVLQLVLLRGVINGKAGKAAASS